MNLRNVELYSLRTVPGGVAIRALFSANRLRDVLDYKLVGKIISSDLFLGLCMYLLEENKFPTFKLAVDNIIYRIS